MSTVKADPPPPTKRREDLRQRIQRIRETPAEELQKTNPISCRRQPKSPALPPLKTAKLQPTDDEKKTELASPPKAPQEQHPSSPQHATWSTFYSSPSRSLPQERLHLRSYLDNTDPVVGLAELSRVKLATLLRAVRDQLQDRSTSGSKLSVEEKKCLMGVADFVSCTELGIAEVPPLHRPLSPRLAPLDTGRRGERTKRVGVQTEPVKFAEVPPPTCEAGVQSEKPKAPRVFSVECQASEMKPRTAAMSLQTEKPGVTEHSIQCALLTASPPPIQKETRDQEVLTDSVEVAAVAEVTDAPQESPPTTPPQEETVAKTSDSTNPFTRLGPEEQELVQDMVRDAFEAVFSRTMIQDFVSGCLDRAMHRVYPPRKRLSQADSLEESAQILVANAVDAALGLL